MLTLFIAVLVIFIFLAAGELLWIIGLTTGEYARKLVHILVAGFIACWPFVMTWQQIKLLSLAMVLMVIFSRVIGLFGSIQISSRASIGDILFPITFGALAYLQPSPVIFAIAVLHLSLADGFAAVIGTAYATRYYTVLGFRKSVVGTTTFMMISAGLLICASAYLDFGTSLVSLMLLVSLPIAAAFFENVGAYGFDNMLVPLYVAAVLSVVS